MSLPVPVMDTLEPISATIDRNFMSEEYVAHDSSLLHTCTAFLLCFLLRPEDQKKLAKDHSPTTRSHVVVLPSSQ